jgi:glycosyltransferase involved in cell wall biosynthesis
MKILWLSWKDITHPDAGGAEISGVEHAKAWVNAGHTVHWVSTNYANSSRQVEKDGITYEHLGQKWMWFLGFIHLLFAYSWITKWHDQYDLVVDEIHGPPLLTPLYSSKQKLVIIHEVAGDIWKKTIPFPMSWVAQYIVEPLFFKAYKNVPIIIGAETTKDDLLTLGIPEKNIKYIPYGVTVPERATNYSKESTPTLIFLSSLRPMKGFDRVYEAYKQIQQKIPNIKLWVVGEDTLPYGQEIKAKVIAENSSVTFYGKVSQEKKFELLQKAHILVHGSYKEGWGLVVIEANLVGTPAVVFDAAGLRNSIVNGKTGYLANDQKDYVNQVVGLLDDQSKYSQIQSNALQWSSQFTWQKSTALSLKILDELA